MKVFFLLIVINVSYFMWQYHQGAFEYATEAPLINKEPMLLISELTKLQGEAVVQKESLNNSTRAVTEKSSADDQQALPKMPINQQNASNAKLATDHLLPAIVCYEAGPFADSRAYNAWVSLVKENKNSLIPIEKNEQIIASYMVYYPVENGREQAELILKMLKSYGMKDMLLQRLDNGQAEISLGVFNSEGRALILKDQLHAKGLEIQIKPRYKTKTRKYVRIFGSDLVLDSLQKIQNRTSEFTVKQIEACD